MLNHFIDFEQLSLNSFDHSELFHFCRNASAYTDDIDDIDMYGFSTKAIFERIAIFLKGFEDIAVTNLIFREKQSFSLELERYFGIIK